MNLAAVQIRRELIDLARSVNGPLGLGRHHDSVEDLAAIAHSPAAEQSAAELHQWTELHQAVTRLEADEREVFDLVFYHGRTQQEVAELCEVHVRTVRRRWHAALLQLQPVLGELIRE